MLRDLFLVCLCLAIVANIVSDAVRLMDDPNARTIVQASSGTHIVLPDYLCPPDLGKDDHNYPS